MNRFPYLFILAGLFAACTSPQKSSEAESDQPEKPEVRASSLSLVKAPESPQFSGATLTKVGSGTKVQSSASEEVTASSAKYLFEVENYELGVQTSDAATRGIANSGKGQHIHFIVNNGPYSAHYMSDVTSELDPGNYTVLAFLSRSYHESVKEPGAFHVENLTVGDVEPAEVDLSTPHLFFSRPKGTYAGEDTETVMLDFYLLNCKLSPEGYNVRATINGEEFLIDDWAPYYMKGLPMGETTIKLELLNKDGELVDSPYNPVERTVTLTDLIE